MKLKDKRGWLQIEFESDNVSIKTSFSKKGVLRGLHHQVCPGGQTKIIRVISGAILDFQYDIQTPDADVTYAKIDSEMGSFLIKERFAHGFYALEDTIFQYVCIGKYRPDLEVSYNIIDALYRDEKIKNVNISDKDANGFFLRNKVVCDDSRLVKV